MAASCVPVIDMQDIAGLPEKLVKAFENWGCLRLINHGVSETLMSEVKAIAWSLLDLPTEIKMRNASPGEGQGYTPPNNASPFFEGIGIYDMAALGAIDDFCYQLGASSQQRYRLATLVIKDDDEIIGGLEAVNKITGELVPVDPMPGTLVINVGDIAKVWSNGRFCNVKHRVQCYEPAIRISVAFFVLGPRDAKIETRPELVDSEHPNIYTPIDFDEYRKLRTTTKAPTGRALDLFRATVS
ncbi:hypothetical protein RJ639_008363 [Escallonia herrerae]|uniref:Uncharacterized protein n=1 Tax=Escallonia herrerae TaxID=1293975 RepID=A0AA88VR51_9ASTE|nr:hypothetical protein RJ639_008363 [Escallonia herrerae]